LIKLGVKRAIEIGPTATLASMFSKSLLKLKEQNIDLEEMGGGVKGPRIEVFSFKSNREELLKIVEEEEYDSI
jgi:hypothetical protein